MGGIWSQADQEEDSPQFSGFAAESSVGYQCESCPAILESAGKLSQHKKDTKFNVNHAARILLQRYSGQDKTQFSAFRKVLTRLEESMRSKGLISRLEYVGSAYEGTAVAGISDYDVMFVRRETKAEVNHYDAPPGYALLTKDGTDIRADKERDAFKGNVQKILNQTSFDELQVKLVDHGPALQLDIGQDSEILVSVDIVLAIETGEGSYVPKPLKPQSTMSWLFSSEPRHLWYLSSSQEMKNWLKTVDRGSCCRKEAYKLVKITRHREPNLKHITSFQIKCCLRELHDEKSWNDHWTRQKVGDRTLDLLTKLASAYRDGRLPHYFIRDVNLIEATDAATKRDTANRLAYLVRCPDKLLTDPSSCTIM